MFIASAPPSVGYIVPLTTLGHHPSGSARFHSDSIVTPASNVAIPLCASKSRMRSMRDRSST
jgi:hypothetical protein